MDNAPRPHNFHAPVHESSVVMTRRTHTIVGEGAAHITLNAGIVQNLKEGIPVTVAQYSHEASTRTVRIVLSRIRLNRAVKVPRSSSKS